MNKKKFILRKLDGMSAFLVFVVVFVVLIFVNSNFLTVMNLRNILRQGSFNGIIAVGMLLVMLTGGIDLSVGSVVALAGGICGKLIGDVPLPIIVMLALVTGVICGFFNGVLVAKFKMAPFIATLATMLGIRSLAHLYIGTSAIPISRDEVIFLKFSSLNVFGIPLPVIIMLVFIIVFAIVLKYSFYGRAIYAVGGNEAAANMMGLNPDRIKISVYMISGFCSALVGVILTARLGSALNTAGDGFEMTAISTVVLGGVYLTGGRGKIFDVFWAILTMSLFTNLFNMLKNSSIWLENIIMGILLIVIVLAQSIKQSDFFKRRKVE